MSNPRYATVIIYITHLLYLCQKPQAARAMSPRVCVSLWSHRTITWNSHHTLQASVNVEKVRHKHVKGLPPRQNRPYLSWNQTSVCSFVTLCMCVSNVLLETLSKVKNISYFHYSSGINFVCNYKLQPHTNIKNSTTYPLDMLARMVQYCDLNCPFYMQGSRTNSSYQNTTWKVERHIKLEVSLLLSSRVKNLNRS